MQSRDCHSEALCSVYRFLVMESATKKLEASVNVVRTGSLLLVFVAGAVLAIMIRIQVTRISENNIAIRAQRVR